MKMVKLRRRKGRDDSDHNNIDNEGDGRNILIYSQRDMAAS